MKNERIQEFFTKVAQDESFKAEVLKFKEEMEAKKLNEQDVQKFVGKVLLPKAKKLGYDFSEKDLVDFGNSQGLANLDKLSLEEMKNVSGGVNKGLLGAMFSLAMFMGVGAGVSMSASAMMDSGASSAAPDAGASRQLDEGAVDAGAAEDEDARADFDVNAVEYVGMADNGWKWQTIGDLNLVDYEQPEAGTADGMQNWQTSTMGGLDQLEAYNEHAVKAAKETSERYEELLEELGGDVEAAAYIAALNSNLKKLAKDEGDMVLDMSGLDYRSQLLKEYMRDFEENKEAFSAELRQGLKDVESYLRWAGNWEMALDEYAERGTRSAEGLHIAYRDENIIHAIEARELAAARLWKSWARTASSLGEILNVDRQCIQGSTKLSTLLESHADMLKDALERIPKLCDYSKVAEIMDISRLREELAEVEQKQRDNEARLEVAQRKEKWAEDELQQVMAELSRVPDMVARTDVELLENAITEVQTALSTIQDDEDIGKAQRMLALLWDELQQSPVVVVQTGIQMLSKRIDELQAELRTEDSDDNKAMLRMLIDLSQTTMRTLQAKMDDPRIKEASIKAKMFEIKRNLAQLTRDEVCTLKIIGSLEKAMEEYKGRADNMASSPNPDYIQSYLGVTMSTLSVAATYEGVDYFSDSAKAERQRARGYLEDISDKLYDSWRYNCSAVRHRNTVLTSVNLREQELNRLSEQRQSHIGALNEALAQMSPFMDNPDVTEFMASMEAKREDIEQQLHEPRAKLERVPGERKQAEAELQQAEDKLKEVPRVMRQAANEMMSGCIEKLQVALRDTTTDKRRELLQQNLALVQNELSKFPAMALRAGIKTLGKNIDRLNADLRDTATKKEDEDIINKLIDLTREEMAMLQAELDALQK